MATARQPRPQISGMTGNQGIYRPIYIQQAGTVPQMQIVAQPNTASQIPFQVRHDPF